MLNFKRKISTILVIAFLLGCACPGNVYASVRGEVSGVLRERSITGKVTCNEKGHHLRVKVKYYTKNTLTGDEKENKWSNNAFGNNAQVSITKVAGYHETMSYLRVWGYVDGNFKKSVDVDGYGFSTREYW